MFFFFFFFSSRRRHTRYIGDWSSDVCSSDLISGWVRNYSDGSVEVLAQGTREQLLGLRSRLREGPRAARVDDEIGRASCRERVESWEGGGGVEKKKGETDERQERQQHVCEEE